MIPPGLVADAGPADPPAGAALHRKLVWLTFFRIATVTVLLGGTALVSWQAGAQVEPPGASTLYAVVLAAYVASLAFALALRARRWLRAIAYAQIVLDVGIAATVVGVTGGTDSMFVFMYALAIVNGSILLFRRGAAAAAGLAVVCHAARTIGSAARAAPLPTLFAQAAALVAIAALTSYLAEQLRSTDERLAEREDDLAAMTALHESIVQSVTSGLLTLDASGAVTFLNRAGEQITGLALREVRGAPAFQAFAMFRLDEVRAEAEYRRAGGERLRLGYSAFPLRGRGSERVGTAIIFQDLTQMRALEEAMARSERLADLGRLAAGLAHELRNPLAAMTGSVELLRASAALGPEAERLMAIVLREAARLEELLRRFLQFTRPAPPVRRAIDVSSVVAETLDVFENDPAAHRVDVERDLAAAVVPCDGDQVRQVIWNLLTNAAHAVAGRDAPDHAAGGRVRVSCAPEPGGGARIAVEDDGPGIGPAERARLFTPFFTTKREGTGLGLATVHRIVEAHGGTVVVDSAPGRGARFVVRLPGAASPAAAAPGARAAAG